MAEGFFEDKPQTEPVKEPEVEKIKLGDSEYTQEELSKLVGLGKVAVEAEEKYNRPISKFWPEFTKSQQELTELKEKLAEIEKTPKQTLSPTGEVTPEQLKEQALKQADELGLLHTGNIQKVVSDMIEGALLLKDIDGLVDEAKDAGKPTASTEDLLNFMKGDNPTKTMYRSPDKAYKDMFETELAAWEKKQLEKIKPEGFSTQESSTAGSKVPPPPPAITKDTLEAAVRSSLNRVSGSEKA